MNENDKYEQLIMNGFLTNFELLDNFNQNMLSEDNLNNMIYCLRTIKYSLKTVTPLSYPFSILMSYYFYSYLNSFNQNNEIMSMINNSIKSFLEQFSYNLNNDNQLMKLISVFCPINKNTSIFNLIKNNTLQLQNLIKKNNNNNNEILQKKISQFRQIIEYDFNQKKIKIPQFQQFFPIFGTYNNIKEFFDEKTKNENFFNEEQYQDNVLEVYSKLTNDNNNSQSSSSQSNIIAQLNNSQFNNSQLNNSQLSQFFSSSSSLTQPTLSQLIAQSNTNQPNINQSNSQSNTNQLNINQPNINQSNSQSNTNQPNTIIENNSEQPLPPINNFIMPNDTPVSILNDQYHGLIETIKNLQYDYIKMINFFYPENTLINTINNKVKIRDTEYNCVYENVLNLTSNSKIIKNFKIKCTMSCMSTENSIRSGIHNIYFVFVKRTVSMNNKLIYDNAMKYLSSVINTVSFPSKSRQDGVYGHLIFNIPLKCYSYNITQQMINKSLVPLMNNESLSMVILCLKDLSLIPSNQNNQKEETKYLISFNIQSFISLK